MVAVTRIDTKENWNYSNHISIRSIDQLLESTLITVGIEALKRIKTNIQVEDINWKVLCQQKRSGNHSKKLKREKHPLKGEDMAGMISLD